MASNSERNGTDLVEKRRSRNRVSQRQFRERRDRYVKELEERVHTLGLNEKQRDTKLLRENDALRAFLHKTRSQLERLRTRVEELCASLDANSDFGVGPPEETQRNDRRRRAAGSCHDASLADEFLEGTNTLECSMRDSVGSAQDAAAIMEDSIIVYDPQTVHETQESPIMYDDIPNLDHISCNVEVDLDQITVAVEPYLDGPCIAPSQLQSDIFEFLGSGYPTIPLETFDNSLRFSFSPGDSRLLQTLYFLLDRELAATQHTTLTLSEHIDRVIAMVRDYLKLVGGLNSYTKTSQACMTAMVVFARYVSPLPATMWFTSYCYLLIERVMFWQVHPNTDLIRCTASAYEPSALQLSTKHSALIDWVVLPPLRDRLITCYNLSRKLDDIFIDLMKHTVIEVADLSKIITGVPSGPGFLGVLNLFNAMNVGPRERIQAVCKDNTIELQDNTFDGLIQMHKMPPPDETWICQVTCSENGYWQPVSFGDLLQSPQLAKQLYHHLRVYDAHKHWKIDPAFYETYPELKYENFEDSCAHGTNYRLTSSWVELSLKMQST